MILLKPARNSKEEELEYVKAMMNQNDIRNSKREACERAMAEGLEKGRAEGRAEVAASLKKAGIDIDIIVSSTGLSKEEINNLPKD